MATSPISSQSVTIATETKRSVDGCDTVPELDDEPPVTWGTFAREFRDFGTIGSVYAHPDTTDATLADQLGGDWSALDAFKAENKCAHLTLQVAYQTSRGGWLVRHDFRVERCTDWVQIAAALADEFRARYAEHVDAHPDIKVRFPLRRQAVGPDATAADADASSATASSAAPTLPVKMDVQLVLDSRPSTTTSGASDCTLRTVSRNRVTRDALPTADSIRPQHLVPVRKIARPNVDGANVGGGDRSDDTLVVAVMYTVPVIVDSRRPIRGCYGDTDECCNTRCSCDNRFSLMTNRL